MVGEGYEVDTPDVKRVLFFLGVTMPTTHYWVKIMESQVAQCSIIDKHSRCLGISGPDMRRVRSTPSRPSYGPTMLYNIIC